MSAERMAEIEAALDDFESTDPHRNYDEYVASEYALCGVARAHLRWLLDRVRELEGRLARRVGVYDLTRPEERDVWRLSMELNAALLPSLSDPMVAVDALLADARAQWKAHIDDYRETWQERTAKAFSEAIANANRAARSPSGEGQP